MTAAVDPALRGIKPEAVEPILAIVRERTGTDFRQYRSAFVQRRIHNRMLAARVNGLDQYLELLQRDTSEPHRLLQRLTIKVSRFYRNRQAFDLLRSDVMPQFSALRRPLRIWSAGCGFGQEAYSLAMLLDEAGAPGVVYATDVDLLALESAHEALYPPEAFTELPQEWSTRYLERSDGPGRVRYRVTNQLRDRVRFCHHDLTSGQPPPGGPEFDLVACRNVLIYMNPEVHGPALDRLRRAVTPGGFLCLGEAEWPSPRVAQSMQVLDSKARVFRAMAA